MKFVILLIIGLFLGSCFNDGNCIITATNYMHIQFKKLSNAKLDTALDLTTIYISGTDSVLLVNSSTTQILVPLDIHSNTTTFVIQRADANSVVTSDTLKVGYSAQSKIIAKDCGAFTYYQNLEILGTNLNESQIKVFSTSLLTDPTLYVASSVNFQAYAVNYQILY
jgi:hypothetical protein